MKKFLSIGVVIAIMIATLLSAQVFAAETIMYGDCNDDAKISMTDLLVMRKYLAKWKVTINETAADVNLDDKVNMTDVLFVRKYLAKWDVELGCTKPDYRVTTPKKTTTTRATTTTLRTTTKATTNSPTSPLITIEGYTFKYDKSWQSNDITNVFLTAYEEAKASKHPYTWSFENNKYEWGVADCIDEYGYMKEIPCITVWLSESEDDNGNPGTKKWKQVTVFPTILRGDNKVIGSDGKRLWQIADDYGNWIFLHDNGHWYGHF